MLWLFSISIKVQINHLQIRKHHVKISLYRCTRSFSMKILDYFHILWVNGELPLVIAVWLLWAGEEWMNNLIIEGVERILDGVQRQKNSAIYATRQTLTAKSTKCDEISTKSTNTIRNGRHWNEEFCNICHPACQTCLKIQKEKNTKIRKH